MKKLTLIITVALAMSFNFTQCKKTDTPTTDEGVFITLEAGYGQSGEKTAFIPSEGSESTFAWTNGATEYIYVGGSNHSDCLGVLTGTGDGSSSISFTGTITPSANETLYFFYLGKGRTGSAVTTLDFSNQDGTLANVTNYHVAISDGVQYTGQTSFSATLNMKMSIAKFDMSDFVNSNNDNEIVYLHGNDIFATASVNYQEGTITGSTKGFVNIGTASAGQYVALIPSTTSQTTLKFDSNSKTGSLTFDAGVTEGKYYSKNGDALAVVANNPLEGTTPGLFSVEIVKDGTINISKKMVRFSKGNLQCITNAVADGDGYYDWSSADYSWSFKEHQYDIDEGGDVGDNYQYRNIISHFGFGTSGGDYPPYLTNDDDDDYIIVSDGGHGYGTITNTQYDWGYNSIENGGNESGLWHTPTIIPGSDVHGEWETIIDCRSGNRYAKAYLFGSIHGLIIFPDNYLHPNNVTEPTGVNEKGENYWNGNNYNFSEWSKMEAAGCVFLPAAGQREADFVGYVVSATCFYSSSTYDVDFDDQWFFKIDNDDDPGMTFDEKYYGNSVRLVHSVE